MWPVRRESMRKSTIALHRDELKPAGVDIQPLSSLKSVVPVPHRDDHYMFVLLQSGSFLWEVDFKEIRMKGPSVCFIAPGQVHRYIDFRKAKGWLVFADTALVPPQYRNIFDTYLNVRQAASSDREDAVFKLIPLLEQVLAEVARPLGAGVLGSLLETISGLVASGLVQERQAASLIGGPKYHTVARFKQLLSTQYKEVKQVKAYAALLHITPLYLNEVLKEVTGFSASYWIQQEVLLEARRMLYYTALDVKQIAYALGYEDHAYFSRFFRKHTGMTALDFRGAKPLFVPS